MRKLLPIFCFLMLKDISQAQSPKCLLNVRIVNSTDYQIQKLFVFDKQFKMVLPGSKTDFFCLDSMFSSVRFDITFQKRKDWGHVIHQPIDHSGDTTFRNGNYELLFIIKKKSRDKYGVSYKVQKVI